jgi:hypothetical protein
MPITRPSRLGPVLWPAAGRRGRPSLAATRLDVLHDLVNGQVGGLRGLLQVLDREMSGIPMILMHLATPTRDTHITGSFPERPPEERASRPGVRSPACPVRALPHHEDAPCDPAPLTPAWLAPWALPNTVPSAATPWPTISVRQ